MYEPNAHVCGVDCERVDMDGHVSHVMYPSEPNSAAGRYQAAANLTMTRREYRASGQDQSRECRVWELARAERIARNERIDNSRRNWGLI